MVFPNDVIQRLLPNEKIQFYVEAPLMGCYFTDKRIMYKANSAVKMANSNKFSLLNAGLSLAMKRQDYDDIPYSRVESVTLDGTSIMPALKIRLIGGRSLNINYRQYDLALQTQQFIMSKIL